MTEEEIELLFTYHAPTNDSLKKLYDVRIGARAFCNLLDKAVPDCEDKVAAIRKLRECVMTANAGIVLNQVVGEGGYTFAGEAGRSFVDDVNKLNQGNSNAPL